MKNIPNYLKPRGIYNNFQELYPTHYVESYQAMGMEWEPIYLYGPILRCPPILMGLVRHICRKHVVILNFLVCVSQVLFLTTNNHLKYLVAGYYWTEIPYKEYQVYAIIYVFGCKNSKNVFLQLSLVTRSRGLLANA